jgi:hypothetical protein
MRMILCGGEGILFCRGAQQREVLEKKRSLKKLSWITLSVAFMVNLYIMFKKLVSIFT